MGKQIGVLYRHFSLATTVEGKDEGLSTVVYQLKSGGRLTELNSANAKTHKK